MKISSYHVLLIQASQSYGFGDVFGPDIVAEGEVGDGAGEFADAVVCARGVAEFFDGFLEQILNLA